MTAAPSRRSILAASGLLAGVGVGVAVGRTTDGDAASTDTAAPRVTGARGLPAALVSAKVRIARPGTKPGRIPAADAPKLPYGELSSPDGTPQGRFDTSTVESSRPMHLQRLEIGDGVLVGLGPDDLDGVFTVVGASGPFAGASGDYAVRRTADGVQFSFNDTKVV